MHPTAVVPSGGGAPAEELPDGRGGREGEDGRLRGGRLQAERDACGAVWRRGDVGRGVGSVG
eukprot:1624638-Prymnesium_polylepis.1